MVAGPHKSTQARLSGKVKLQNESSKTKQLQRQMVQWVLNNPDKVEAMSDMINNGQVDMYIHGQVVDNNGQKPLLRSCISWVRISLSDKRKVLFNGKHMENSSSKKLAKPTTEEEKLWVFLTAGQTHKRWGKQKATQHSAIRGQRLMLSRYLESCRSFLKNNHEFTIAYDASRIGGKEVLLLVLLATCNVSGHTKACWAPPQVSALVCF